MRLLILGGTWFLGRTLAELALGDGWQVTTFFGGRSGHDVPGTQQIRGDRNDLADVRKLASAGPWEAIAETSGYAPSLVEATAA